MANSKTIFSLDLWIRVYFGVHQLTSIGFFASFFYQGKNEEKTVIKTKSKSYL